MKNWVKGLLRPVARNAPEFVQQWWYLRQVDLENDAKRFVGFSAELRPAMEKVANTRFYRYYEEREIPGWLTPKERQTLYALARWIPGPVTEIGSWVGLSTSAIARGVRDSGATQMFRTYDLRLTPENFRKMPEGGIGMFLPGDEFTHGVCTEESYRRRILPILSEPGGSNALLKKHLSMLGLLKFVEINIGDFRSFPPITSGLVFCDALHDEHEIEVNAPALKPWLRSGSVIACHDVGSLQRNIELLRKHIDLGYGVAVDSLYVAEVL